MYERYREIIHNDFRGLEQKHVLNVSNNSDILFSEHRFQEIAVEESFEKTVKKLEKKHKEQKAAINFTYQDGEAPKPPPSKPEEENSDMEESDDEG